jgi:hypothetical protein
MCVSHARSREVRLRVALTRLVSIVLLILGSTKAEADGAGGEVPVAQFRGPVEAAPGVAASLLRGTARMEFEAFMAHLPAAARRRLVGAYLAFDDSVTDVDAMIGCDDDGDYVVIVTDALLGLASFVGKAEAVDETCGAHKVLDYATYLAESWRNATPAAVRPMPPPPGFFDGSETCSVAGRNLDGARFAEIVGAVVARELTRLVRGELACPNPTATHERGDDRWTPEERQQSLAWELAHDAPVDGFSAEDNATTCILDVGLTERGGLAWLRVADRVERAMRESVSRGGGGLMQTYLRLHPNSLARIEVVRAAADRWEKAHAPPPTRPSSARPTWSPASIPKIRALN